MTQTAYCLRQMIDHHSPITQLRAGKSRKMLFTGVTGDTRASKGGITLQLIRASLYRGPSPVQIKRLFISSAQVTRQSTSNSNQTCRHTPGLRDCTHQPHTMKYFQLGRIYQADRSATMASAWQANQTQPTLLPTDSTSGLDHPSRMESCTCLWLKHSCRTNTGSQRLPGHVKGLKGYRFQ